MPTETKDRWALLLAGLGTLAIIIVSLVPIQFRPHVLAVSQVEHFACYFATAVPFAWVWRKPWEAAGVIGILSLLAAALEVAQFWVPGRTPRIADWLAGSLGASASFIFVLGAVWLNRALRRSNVV